MMWCVFISWILLWNIHSISSNTCITEDSKAIDWFIIYKFPNGGKHVYILPNSTSWTASKYSINGTENMLYRTINQAYRDRSEPDVLNAFYNDQIPKNNIWYGHMKGILNFKRKLNGFWLIHSQPHFPGLNKYNFNTLIYGQIFMCITLPYSSLGSIAKQLLVALPKVYGPSHLPSSIARDFPDLVKVFNHKGKATVNKQTVTLKSSGGVEFTHFAKSVAFNSDLYSCLVAPHLQVSLLFEGWTRMGTKNLPSNCSGTFHVENIKAIKFSSPEVAFKTTCDHAKWCISKTSSQPWVCVGDINRQVGQLKRGGGTMCFNNLNVWKQFNAIVSSVEKCDKIKLWVS